MFLIGFFTPLNWKTLFRYNYFFSEHLSCLDDQLKENNKLKNNLRLQDIIRHYRTIRSSNEEPER